jgi:NADPH:quinone reductase-like Zn-dependent oxidoreductase
MPLNASFEEAAAIIFGGQTAIYFLNKARIAERPFPKILIIGATGSVGTAAIQLAKHYHADITAVCSLQGLELVQSLGVNKVFLYDKQSYSDITDRFDIVFDAVGKSNKNDCKKLLKENGIFKTVSRGYASESVEQLKLLKELFEKGSYKAVIDKHYTLNDIVEAHQYVDTGRKKGNVVLKIGN